MVNPFLTNEALENFVKSLEIEEEKKTLLISKIPQMDEEERVRLFETLKGIYLLDLEEKEAIERIRKFRSNKID